MIFKTANSTYCVDRAAKKICRLSGKEEKPTSRIGAEWIEYETFVLIPSFGALIAFPGGKMVQTSAVVSVVEEEET